MNHLDAALVDAAEAAGFDGQDFGQRGAALVQLESGRRAGLEHTPCGIAVYVSHHLPYDAGAWLRRAWRRNHYSCQEDWPVQAALSERDGNTHLVALTRIADADFSPQRLQQALDYLARWLDAVRDDAY
ncbi:hypothetical protein [Bordetella sp. BOR01]|uniref:hypothetical protein n=1 Tax=Bordetella sp. BOR01 TaxID=2854779 RepID=UPI001C44DB6F|nr:hypothetical protein [Bordetella sp. BOR01]MBV7485213.1 hypothetical protein [Bordetella sp. BOR01]